MLRQALVATAYRFPLVLTSALFGTLTAIYLIEYQPDQDTGVMLLHIFSMGVPLFLSHRLFIERRHPSKPSRRYLLASLFVFLFIYYWALPESLSYIQYLRFSLMMIALHLMVAFVPYLGKKELNGFWHYNQALLIRLLAAFLYSMVLYFGILIALVALDQLFDVRVQDEIYLELWVVIIGIFHTCFFLAGVPRDFAQLEQEQTYPGGLKVFTEYVLLPLVTLYLVILYSYTLKILLEWDLPRGWVTYLVIILSAAGIFSLLLIYPIQDQIDNQWIKTFAKRFYIALFPLILLLFVAVGRRIADYGITEPRYLVVLIALWLLGNSIYFLLSRVKNIKIIPISLCLLTLVAAVGPWGAFQTAQNSQIGRLEDVLRENKLLKNGLIVKNKDQMISEEDLDQISSILNFLNQRGRLDALQPYFKEDLDSLFADELTPYAREEKLLTLIGNPELSRGVDVPTAGYQLNFSATREKDVQEIKGYEYLIHLEKYSENSEPTYRLGKQETKLQVDYEAKQIILLNARNNRPLIQFDLNLTIDNLIKEHENRPHDIPLREMTLIEESRRYKAKLQLFNIGIIRLTKSQSRCTGLNGELFIRLN